MLGQGGGRGVGKLVQADVLQALSGLVVDGVEPLASGYVQDVAIEWHADVAYVGVHVDELWSGHAPSEAAMAAMRERVLGLAGVGAARIIPRSAERAARARAIAQRGRRAQQPPALPPGVRLVAVASGKGGVGKSTVAVHLALALARAGVRAALLDCDIYGFSAPRLIGVEGRPAVEGGRMVPPRVRGVEVMSMDFFVREGQAVMWRGPMLGKALRQMTEETAWSDPEVMVLDLPPGTGDIALDVHAFFPAARVLVVTTPDPAAARVAVRAGEMAAHVGHVLLGVVENLSYAACACCGTRQHLWGSGGGDLVAEALGAPLLARVPWHPALGPGRVPEGPSGEAAAVYDALAADALRAPAADEAPQARTAPSLQSRS
jgi:ATP-binding protein involved in chromosome partitioning